MDIQEMIICRLCFQACENSKAVEGELSRALHMVLKKIDVTIFPEPIMCTYCAAMLTKCSQFKTKCFDARDCLLPFIDNKGDGPKLNLKEVYLSTSENGFGLAETHDICGFCMSPVKSCSVIPFDLEGVDSMLQNMVKKCLPELNFSIIKKPVICAPCHKILESCFYFVKNCLIVEDKIKEFREIQDTNGKGQIELGGLLEFMTRNVTIKVEKDDANEEEIGSGSGTLKVKQILFCDVNKTKNESCTEIDDHFMPKNMLPCEGDIKIDKTFCEGIKFKEENVDVLHQLEEEIDIKTEECDFNRSENDVLPLPEVTTRLDIKQKCSTPEFEQLDIKQTVCKCESSFRIKNRGSLQKRSQKHKDPLEVTMYTCDSCNNCLYQTRNKSSLNRHLLMHKDPSEVTIYKCKACSYQTNRKCNLKKHLLLHKDPSEVTIYKCNNCLYQTNRKGNLKKHILKHKDPAEVTMYKCSECSFQTKLMRSLKRHNMLIHKDPSEVTMYKCYSCLFQSKLKNHLKEHLMKHKDPSELTTYRCSLCSFQTKLKGSLKRHNTLQHRDPSEVTMYKCDTCFFQTKHKSNFKDHLLKHKDPSEVTMYKCSFCSFQTKLKRTIKLHTLKHKDPSEVTMYKCDACLYQSICKNSLKLHLLTHKDPSEVTMYKCSLCSFQAKLKTNLNRHMLTHTDPSEVTMYKCDSCFFQTKLKGNLNRHLLRHEDPS